jgi:DNA-binding MarR family transcriptional regulator
MSKDEEIGMLTNQTNKIMLRYINSNLEKFGLTTEQWNVLKTLSKEETGINQKKLSIKTDKDQPTIVRILDILERKKFVERIPSKDDRRAFIINLTESGRNIIDTVEPFIESLFKMLLDGISEEKLNTYSEVLMSISKNIKNEISCRKN